MSPEEETSEQEGATYAKIYGEKQSLDSITDSTDMSWVPSGSWWWTGRPGMLQSMGSQRVRHDLTTKQ